MNNKVFRFFQELKRRNVLRVIAMYAGSAFVLWDLANNVVEPMNLPDWIPRIVIWVSLIGFPLIAIISWLYDLTGGVPRTLVVAEEDTQIVLQKRNVRVSDGIIVALIVLVGFLAYPRIIQRTTSLKVMTIPQTIENELGEKETRMIFKENHLYKIGVIY